jgi:F-type H+-transporting ATPase subunit gamma
MPNLRDIQDRITSTRSTRQITRTMEMVATAKIRKAQDRIESARPYALAIMEVLGNVAKASGVSTHPLLEEHGTLSRVVVIAVASDRGLCGAFNSNILRLSEQAMREARQAGAEAAVIAVGKKAIAYFRYRGIEPVATYRDIADAPSIGDARSIASRVIEGYTAREIDAVKIVFNRFKSAAEQVPEVHDLLPIRPEVVRAAADDLTVAPEYIFEPSTSAVLERLLPTYVETLVYRALLESAASEQGARRRAMKSATDNAGEMITTLTRSYNRARQGAITNEIAEIVGGAAALEES